jgi:hypothetical protein
MSSVDNVNRSSLIRRLAPILLMWALLAQVSMAARHTSITLDEPLHITSGYASLVTGDYRLVEEHPPFLKMLQAAPLLWAKPPLPDPASVPGWEEGNLIEAARHVVVDYRPIEPLVFAARVPTMLVAVILGALVLRWAADLFGGSGGLLALTLFTFDPNILAHSAVAATDLGAACAIFASAYLFWRWLREKGRPSPRRAVAAAVVLGLSLTVKSTALMLLPVFAALVLFARPRKRAVAPYLRQSALAALVAFVTLWAVYRFEVRALPGFDLPLPAASHLLPLLRLRSHMREGHAAFLMGRNYHHGVWYYFPVAFLLKTPPLTLVALAVTALGLGARRLRSPGRRPEFALLALPLLYLAVSLTSGINIGYRHLLPALPFLFVWVARLASQTTRPVLRWAGAAALVGYVVVTLALFPWHLAYFNAFAGGTEGGYRYLVDSNLDWGQNWKALKAYVDEEGITEYGLSQYTINDPSAYDLDYTPLPPWPDAPPVLPQRFAPPPGVYAISTTQLQGVVVADPEMYDYFRHLEPEARIGHALFVYEVGPRPGTDWVAQCTLPTVPLPPVVLAEGLGQNDLRSFAFDCSQSWLIPPGKGWYALHGEYEGWGEAWAERGRLAYRQTRAGFVPPFALYEWFDVGDFVPQATPVRPAPDGVPPDRVMTAIAPTSPPVAVGDSLRYLGYRALDEHLEPGATFEVESYWQITGVPTRPLSLMAHLLGADGRAVAVGDGLGVPVDQWQAGSTLVQRHIFDLPAELGPGPVWFQTGAYTQPDLRRLPVLGGVESARRVVVTGFEVAEP